MNKILATLLVAFLFFGCASKSNKTENMQAENTIQKKADEFVPFKLTTDLSVLTEKEKQMLPLLFEAAQLMDDIFWMEAYGNKEELLEKTGMMLRRNLLRLTTGLGKG